MGFYFVSLHNSNCFLHFTFVGKVFDQVTHHLLDTREQIFNSIKSQEVLLIRILVQVSTKKIAHTVLQDPLFQFREIIHIQSEVFDKLGGLLSIVICGEGSDEFELELVIV